MNRTVLKVLNRWAKKCNYKNWKEIENSVKHDTHTCMGHPSKKSLVLAQKEMVEFAVKELKKGDD